ncbi:MAG: ROK family protein [Mycobacterium sp.]
MTSTIPTRAVTHNRVHPLRNRHHVVAPSLRVPEAAPSAVFAAVRQRGPVARDAIATHTGLSIATVNRQVSALLDAELLRERPDLAVPGAIGRPRIPVEINHEPYLTLGLHIGARTTSIVASDLFGRTLDAVETPTPGGSQSTALAALADSARRYLGRWHRRRPLWVGVAIGGVVDSTAGQVDHPRLGWAQAPVGAVLGAALTVPVSVASHVDAMAGAELLLGSRPARQADHTSSLYIYARETVGFALVIGGRVHTPASGPGTVAGLPVQSDLLAGGCGHLESTVSDEAVVAAARKAAILPATGPNSTIAALARLARRDGTGTPAAARNLLAERARVLGGAVALLRDLLNPDDLVVGGQAFTEYPEGLPHVRDAFAERSLLAARDIRVTAFGNRVQEAGAGVVSLSSLYADPLGALRRSRHRIPEVSA